MRKSYTFSIVTFDLQALCRLASRLRQGSTCRCDVNQVPESGSFNWAIYIVFEDGIQWLLESEAATLSYVRRNSDIPVPHYILMSKATGFPLRRVWKSTRSGQTELSAKIKTKILFQLGTIAFKLSQLRLGCHIFHERYSLEDVPRGPFSSETRFYDSLVDALIQHAEILPLSHHCFVAPVPCQGLYDSTKLYKTARNLWNDFVTVGCKIDSSDNRLDYIITGEHISKLNYNSFPLCHSDLSVNNIYVDDDYNITCIIDWAFCSSVPEAMDDYCLFTVVWGQIYGSDKDLKTYFPNQHSLCRNIKRHKEIPIEYQSPEKIEKAEHDYFRDDVLKNSIARSLTVIRLERGDLFIADSELWKWISKVI
ncbi:hypothetical protein BDV32DRAFT_135311 [Aspergillus pseudonomiae]|uniref:Uncharacterized protein n=1 Tax=Aspergillus pseudonomiae TaxID=1506151 RepID=A0A5N7DSH8_9EURO|nr:uncharacterized protein BDV37DRAFT_267962 [Aspergillus pseudonomiae]KAB8264394.1 hypothetical protein BDV32DRAFT_135311 [Aspergillus pseudonomiae]KAE8409245.1 hypothetical protein BDV37DRAFT_267962 [Aspergillus pseudonomiae]